MTCPFRLLVDTREQRPYLFSDKYYLQHGLEGIDKKALVVGDYTIEDIRHQVAIERKQLGEYLICLGTDRRRFEAEVVRATELGIMLFCIIEGTNNWSNDKEVQQATGSRLTLASIHGTEASWSTRYNYRVFYCGSRTAAEMRCFNLLLYFYKKLKQAEMPQKGRKRRGAIVNYGKE